MMIPSFGVQIPPPPPPVTLFVRQERGKLQKSQDQNKSTQTLCQVLFCFLFLFLSSSHTCPQAALSWRPSCSKFGKVVREATTTAVRVFFFFSYIFFRCCSFQSEAS